MKGGPKGTCNDCLIQVDPKTGAFLLDWGPLDRADVFGLAFWGGAVYGFDTAGELFEVQFHGLATQITTIPDPGAPAGLQWFGAGSTTSAPIRPGEVKRALRSAAVATAHADEMARGGAGSDIAKADLVGAAARGHDTVGAGRAGIDALVVHPVREASVEPRATADPGSYRRARGAWRA